MTGLMLTFFLACPKPEPPNPGTMIEDLDDREVWSGTFDVAIFTITDGEPEPLGALHILKHSAEPELGLEPGDERWSWADEQWPDADFSLLYNEGAQYQPNWQKNMLTHQTFGPAAEPISGVDPAPGDRFYELEVVQGSEGELVGWLWAKMDNNKLESLTWYKHPDLGTSLIVIGGDEELKLSPVDPSQMTSTAFPLDQLLQ